VFADAVAGWGGGEAATASGKKALWWRDAPSARLAALGVVAFLAYLAGTWAFPLLRYYCTPLLDLGKLLDHSVRGGLLYTAAAAVCLACYGLALRITSRSGARLGVVLVFGLLFSVALFFSYPWGAADLFDYAVIGKVLGQYELNPYVVTGAELAGEPWVDYAPWSDTTSAYGPLWTALAGAVSRLAGKGLLANLLAFKGVALAFHWLDILLIALCLRETRPDRVAAGVLFYAWNPLVLVETLANGHNDNIMLAGMLLAVWLALRGRMLAAMLPLAGAVLTKFWGGLLFPLIIAAGLREQPRSLWRRLAYLAVAALLFGGALALGWAPFWAEGQGAWAGFRLQLFTTSWPLVARLALERWLEPARAMALAQGLALGATAAYALARAVRVRRAELPEASYDLIFFYLAFGCAWFQPWYLIWLVGLAAASWDRERLGRAALFSALGLLSYLLYHFVWFGWGLDHFSIDGFRALAMAATVLPPGALWLARGCMANR